MLADSFRDNAYNLNPASNVLSMAVDTVAPATPSLSLRQDTWGAGAGVGSNSDNLTARTELSTSALGRARVAGGKVEGQGAQRVDDAKTAAVLAVQGFNANDADDDFGGHPGLDQRAGLGQFVRLQRLHG